MAEFIQSAEQFVDANEPVVFVNNTDSSFEVGAGIIFRKSGFYEVSVVENRITVTKVSDLTREALEQEPCNEQIDKNCETCEANNFKHKYFRCNRCEDKSKYVKEVIK